MWSLFSEDVDTDVWLEAAPGVARGVWDLDPDPDPAAPDTVRGVWVPDPDSDDSAALGRQEVRRRLRGLIRVARLTYSVRLWPAGLPSALDGDSVAVGLLLTHVLSDSASFGATFWCPAGVPMRDDSCRVSVAGGLRSGLSGGVMSRTAGCTGTPLYLEGSSYSYV